MILFSKVSKKCSRDAGVNCSPIMMLEGRPPSEVLVAVLIFFTTCKCYDLSSYVRAEFLLACAVLDHNICTDLAVLESYELKRHNICSLVKKLIEGVLSVCSRLSEDNRSCYIINRLTKTVYGFSVRLHIQLLQMCGKRLSA